MPSSPASGAATSHRQSISARITKTRRSGALSTAFNDDPTQVGSGVRLDHGSQHSAPASTSVSKGTSVGTMVNPAATALELMSKSPSMAEPSDRTPTSLSPVSSPKAAGASGHPPPASTAASRSSPGSQAKDYASGSTKRSHERSGTSSSGRVDPEVSHMNSGYHNSNVGHGVIDVNVRRGALIQIVFSTLALFLFMALWIYLMTAANCFRNFLWDFFMKCLSMAGAICALFVILASCFDRQTTTRGVFGCVIFFVMTIVIFLNIFIGFNAMNCVCRCPPNTNAYSEGSVADLTIFGFSVAGSFCLIIVLLVASVVHD